MFVCGDRAVSTKNVLTIAIIYGGRESDKIQICYRDAQPIDLIIPKHECARDVFFDLLGKIKREEDNA